jgi:hypothetical protein
VTRHFGKRRYIQARKDANGQRHVEARLLDVLGECVVIIIDRMPVHYSVSMLMTNDMAMRPVVRMAENEAEIVMAGISGRSFRRGNKHALQRNSRGCHHHDNDGDASGHGLSREAQFVAFSNHF